MRVGDLVVDHEAGVDRALLAILIKGAGVGVTADVSPGFEHRDLVTVAQEVRAAEPGNTGADDGEGLHLSAEFGIRNAESGMLASLRDRGVVRVAGEQSDHGAFASA